MQVPVAGQQKGANRGLVTVLPVMTDLLIHRLRFMKIIVANVRQKQDNHFQAVANEHPQDNKDCECPAQRRGVRHRKDNK